MVGSVLVGLRYRLEEVGGISSGCMSEECRLKIYVGGGCESRLRV